MTVRERIPFHLRQAHGTGNARHAGFEAGIAAHGHDPMPEMPGVSPDADIVVVAAGQP